MRVAILGPLCKDEVVIDGKKTHSGIGSPVYYIGTTLKHLGVNVTAFATFATDELAFFQNNMSGVEIVHIPQEPTLRFLLEYSSKNPDVRVHRTKYVDNTITVEDIEKYDFTAYDYVIFGPLFYNNTPKDVFEFINKKNKNIILGNFGMFNYAEGERMVKKNPDNLTAVLKYVKCLFLDADEVKFVAQKSTVEEAVAYLQKFINNIIVTEASQGSTIFFGNSRYEIPAFPPKKLIDPTGAGDCYLAGFIKAKELFSDIQKQGEFAAMTATYSIEKKGASMATVDDVYERLGWKKE